MKLSSYPHLVKEWHPSKNGELTPDDYTHGSDRKVWWVCLKGHSYSTSVSDRTRQKPISCAYCAGKKASKENNLETLFPEIAKEWHPSKNNDLSPNQVTRASTKKVWWECTIGHSYESTIANRTRNKNGCPYCAGRKASDENNLEALFPEIAKEWHPTKNKDLVPSEVTYGTHKKVWWLCPKEHSYESAVRGRTGKHQNACPQSQSGTLQRCLVVYNPSAWHWNYPRSLAGCWKHRIRFRIGNLRLNRYLTIGRDHDTKAMLITHAHQWVLENKSQCVG
jgi:hypothetical protein